jgi:Protein of unknown function (DUF3501)
MSTASSGAPTSRKLTLADIADARAYERQRLDVRAGVIELRRRRRVGLGDFVSVSFENRETIRYQIQEMARVEKLFTDEAITDELNAYNPLVPERGELKATMFIELTSDESIRAWLPVLVGIEQSIVLRLADGTEIRAKPEARHAAQLTRSGVTSAVHYLEFVLDSEQIDCFAAGQVVLACDHPAYREHTELTESTVGELLGDLLAG